VSNDPANPESKRRFLINTKFNIGDKPNSLAFEIKDGKVVFEKEPVNITAQDIFEVKREAPQRDEIGEWLLDSLKDGPKPAKVIYKQAKIKNYCEKTLKSAKKAKDITSYYVWNEKTWYWKLPESKDKNSLFTDEHNKILEQNGFKVGPLEI
jgi:hypothetical protein